MSDIEEKKLCCPYCGRSIYEICNSATIDKMYPDGIFKESYIMSKEEFEMIIKDGTRDKLSLL